ncbi:MAG TPA: efflux RND transporter periplasmic adaptor subunit [Terriglobales bacterium]|nr:efflux RND transporter periplasmic adaptor subunit [Terriglobales bacterium]
MLNRSQAAKLGVIGLVVALTPLAGCGRSGQVEVKAANNQMGNSAVRYVQVAQKLLTDTLDLAAKVQPDPTKVVRIFPPASGRVVSIAVKPGDHVERGQTVAVLTSSDIATARSDFAKAKIEAERATRAKERENLLFEHGAAAEKDYIDARAQADSARAELARAQERLDLLNINPATDTDRVSLVAPGRGVVLDVSAAPGEFSKSLESANPLITIANLDTVWVMGDVYEKDAAKLSVGKPVIVTLQAYEGQQWKGRIDSISGALDPSTRTLKVRIALPNRKQLLKPEMFATVHVTVGAHQTLVIPAAAVIREGNVTTVFAKQGNTPEQRTVSLGQSVDGVVEVLGGLRLGEEVVAEGAELLKGGPGE